MASGISIRTIPLKSYPFESQKLMVDIIQDFKEKYFKVKEHTGSYSIIGKEGKTAMKVLCTIDSNYKISGLAVGIFFRKELIDKEGLDSINILFPKLIIKTRFFMIGAGKYEDFYLTEIDSNKTYLDKKEEVFKLGELILNF